MQEPLENAAPTVHAKAGARSVLPSELDDDVTDPFDAREIFDLLRDINDPEVRFLGSSSGGGGGRKTMFKKKK